MISASKMMFAVMDYKASVWEIAVSIALFYRFEAFQYRNPLYFWCHFSFDLNFASMSFYEHMDRMGQSVTVCDQY